MVSGLRRVHHTHEEYLALEQASPTRHEYLDGEIYAMAGGSPDHAALAAAVLGLLARQLPRGCRTFTSDLRVRIEPTGLSTHPDAAVICGPSERSSADALAVTNPVILVEVTSPSTEDYDRGEKLRHYQQLASVQEILIVSHRAPRLTLYRREGGSFRAHEAGPGETIQLVGLGAQLAVDEVYREALEDAR